jgi:hypothetical protein
MSRYKIMNGEKVLMIVEAADSVLAWWVYCRVAGIGSDHPAWHYPPAGFTIGRCVS